MTGSHMVFKAAKDDAHPPQDGCQAAWPKRTFLVFIKTSDWYRHSNRVISNYGVVGNLASELGC